MNQALANIAQEDGFSGPVEANAAGGTGGVAKGGSQMILSYLEMSSNEGSVASSTSIGRRRRSNLNSSVLLPSDKANAGDPTDVSVTLTRNQSQPNSNNNHTNDNNAKGMYVAPAAAAYYPGEHGTAYSVHAAGKPNPLAEAGIRPVIVPDPFLEDTPASASSFHMAGTATLQSGIRRFRGSWFLQSRGGAGAGAGMGLPTTTSPDNDDGSSIPTDVATRSEVITKKTALSVTAIESDWRALRDACLKSWEPSAGPPIGGNSVVGALVAPQGGEAGTDEGKAVVAPPPPLRRMPSGVVTFDDSSRGWAAAPTTVTENGSPVPVPGEKPPDSNNVTSAVISFWDDYNWSPFVVEAAVGYLELYPVRPLVPPLPSNLTNTCRELYSAISHEWNLENTVSLNRQSSAALKAETAQALQDPAESLSHVLAAVHDGGYVTQARALMFRQLCNKNVIEVGDWASSPMGKQFTKQTTEGQQEKIASEIFLTASSPYVGYLRDEFLKKRKYPLKISDRTLASIVLKVEDQRRCCERVKGLLVPRSVVQQRRHVTSASSFLEVEVAAAKIQRTVRNYLYRMRVAELLRVIEKAQAVTSIQRAVRGWLGRCRARRERKKFRRDLFVLRRGILIRHRYSARIQRFLKWASYVCKKTGAESGEKSKGARASESCSSYTNGVPSAPPAPAGSAEIAFFQTTLWSERVQWLDAQRVLFGT
eukprot:gene1557-1803_t